MKPTWASSYIPQSSAHTQKSHHTYRTKPTLLSSPRQKQGVSNHELCVSQDTHHNTEERAHCTCGLQHWAVQPVRPMTDSMTIRNLTTAQQSHSWMRTQTADTKMSDASGKAYQDNGGISKDGCRRAHACSPGMLDLHLLLHTNMHLASVAVPEQCTTRILASAYNQWLRPHDDQSSTPVMPAVGLSAIEKKFRWLLEGQPQSLIQPTTAAGASPFAPLSSTSTTSKEATLHNHSGEQPCWGPCTYQPSPASSKPCSPASSMHVAHKPRQQHSWDPYEWQRDTTACQSRPSQCVGPAPCQSLPLLCSMLAMQLMMC